MFLSPNYSSIIGILFNCLASVLFFENPPYAPQLPNQWTPPDNFLHTVTPLQCHSHNDYYHRTPLYEALSHGCTGIEVDVWAFNNELYVGHYATDLVLDRTLRKLYLDPLTALLDERNNKHGTPPQQGHYVYEDPRSSEEGQNNGVFPSHPTQTLILLIDFKNNGSRTLPLVHAHIAPLRHKDYLTHFNGTHTVPGPITVVATGYAPFDLLVANTTYRDIFFDAPLASFYSLSPSSPSSPSSPLSTSSPSSLDPEYEDYPEPATQYNIHTSYYASANFRRAVGHLWMPWRWATFYPRDLERVRGMLTEARRRGLKTRFWGAPGWPRGLRDAIWTVLVREGVDFLNGDDVAAMADMMR